MSQHVLQDAVLTLEEMLQIAPSHRRHICIRLDGGFGTDPNINWCLQRHYQLVAKGKSGRRAGAWGRQVRDWQVILPDKRWIALSPKQHQFWAPTRTVALRWRNKHGKLKHSLLIVTDMHSSLIDLSKTYNLRGAAEVDIRQDKQGIFLAHHRKRAWHAQEMLVLLNDLAHNFIFAIRNAIWADTPLAEYGLYRLVHEVFTVPGQAIMVDGHLRELQLLLSTTIRKGQ